MHSKNRNYIILAAVILAAGFFAFRHFSHKRRPNVVFILLDTLRADHLGTYGYERDTSPVLDDFARNNIKFNYAITAAPWTPPSVASMFTGMYPSSHGMMPPNSREVAKKKFKTLDDGLTTLAETFKANGYQTAAVTSNPWMVPEFGYKQGFDHYEVRVRDRAGKITAAGKRVVTNLLNDSRQPFFLYLHYLDPHDPYSPPGDFAKMFSGPLSKHEYSPDLLEDIGRYDGEIRYLDTQLGELFKFFKEKGIYDDLVIVIVGDHGEQFMERGHKGHGFNLFNEEVHVPLLLKAGGEKGEVDDAVSTIDVFPTLLLEADIDLPLGLQSRSLTQRDSARSGIISEIHRIHNQRAFINREGKKIIYDFTVGEDASTQPQGQLIGIFDKTPKGVEGVPAVDNGESTEMGAQLKEQFDIATQKKQAVKELEINDDTINDLKSLGYLK